MTLKEQSNAVFALKLAQGFVECEEADPASSWWFDGVGRGAGRKREKFSQTRWIKPV
jgi:hypothetical protein